MEKYVDFRNSNNYEKLKYPADIIRNGGIVVFPTETVYGIGTNGLDINAVEKLFKIKERPLDKPISLIVSDFEMIEKVAQNITEIEYKIMKKFFPGPLTIILNKRDIVPDILTSGQKTVGIRMPEEVITRKLIEYTGVPVAATSANISGEPSGIMLENIMEQFREKADYFIDGGKSKIGISSAVVKVINGVPNILRKGSISEKEIKVNEI